MREPDNEEGEQGNVPRPEGSIPEDREDFDDSFLREVARTELPLRVPVLGTRMGGREGHRFEILEELGGGGMGRVFRARDCELRREVALKFLLPRSLRAGSQSSAQLMEEARAIAGLDHENIVRLFDVSEWGGTPAEPWVPFLVMECLEGESLASLLRRERPGLRRTLEILGAVVTGLAHAHAHHLVHRDLKPSNVFITREGRVKLLDFGLAHLVSAESPLVPHLPTAGTPAYMAPEQWRGEEQDARTDLWAVGVVAYELLTGELPYPFTSLQELRERVTSAGPVPSVRERVPEVPEEVERLVGELLSKDPGRRLDSASGLRERLRRLEESVGPWRESPRLVAPQRRQVTLVSCWLARPSLADEPVDPEDASEQQAAFHRRCAEIIQRHEGVIALSVGDEVLACFGHPTAREDDSERAVRAGLEVATSGLAVEVGLHTDTVVFDALPSEELGRMPTLQGEAPRRAAVLARQAGPGAVVLGKTTWKLVRGVFELEPLGAPPAEAYRVLRERHTVSRFERALAAGRLSPWVGREQELARLSGFWEWARRGRGACVLIRGEAGIGKSRLIQELRERVSAESSHLLLCQCWEPSRDSAFHPIIELLRRLGPLPEQEPEIAALLASPEAGDSSSVLAALEHQKERKRKVLEALRRLFSRMAAERPVLLVLEDLHWADPSTLELLGLLAGDVTRARLLVVLSARPEFHASWPPSPGFHSLVLERLPAESAAALVRQMEGGSNLPEETVRQLVAKTDGIPLFVEEMTRMVLERSVSGSLSAIPVTLHELLRSRLDALPSRQKALAQLCAVVGRGFPLALISRLLACGEGQLQEDVLGLVSAGLLQRQWEDSGASEAYQFRHALIQEAAYQSLPRGPRRQHHRRVAQALVEGFPDVVERRPEVLAYHYTEAGEAGPAIRCWERAARLAVSRAASVEAIAHLKRALALLRSAPDAASRVEEELRLLSGLGILLMNIQGYATPEVAQTYERALELFRQRQDVLPAFAQLWLGLGAYYIMGARFAEAHALVGQILALDSRKCPPRLLATAYRMRASLCCYEGELERALEAGDQAVRITGPQYEVQGVISDHVWLTEWVDDRFIPCLVHLLQARPRESRRFGDEFLALLRGPVHFATRAIGLLFMTMAHQLEGDVPETLRSAEHCLQRWFEDSPEAATGSLFQALLALAKGLHGWALAWSGRAGEGLALLRSGLEPLRRMGVTVFVSYYLQLLADVFLMLGQVEEGLAAVEEGLELTERTGARLIEAELHRLRGALLLASGREEDARLCLIRAATVAHRQKAWLFELRARVALARQLRDTGYPEAARRRLERLGGRFTPDLEVPELQEAHALLAALTTPAPPPHRPHESPPGDAR